MQPLRNPARDGRAGNESAWGEMEWLSAHRSSIVMITAEVGYAVRGERRQKVSGSAANWRHYASADKSDEWRINLGIAGLATGCDRSSLPRNAFNVVSRSSSSRSPSRTTSFAAR
jgi:hypothetical protein